jgi:arylformamidase
MATKDRPLDPRLNWAALSPAERDAAYDNNAAVKHSAALIAERNQASETLRASRNSFLDVPYGDRERTKIDLYPAADKAAPCLVFLHGGYWQRDSREVFAMLDEGVAAHGWSVAIPGYSLEASLTQIVAEISEALDWLAENGESYGISGPVILSGWSAGDERKKIEMRFAHLKRILRLGRLRLRGPRGAQDEFVLAAIAQNLRRLATLVARPPPANVLCIA